LNAKALGRKNSAILMSRHKSLPKADAQSSGGQRYHGQDQANFEQQGMNGAGHHSSFETMRRWSLAGPREKRAAAGNAGTACRVYFIDEIER
jgi:hypothetical protein